MPIPDFESVMLPLLQFASDEREHSLKEAVNALHNEFGLTDEEQKTLLPCGKQPVFRNRVSWACTYMKKAVLLYSPRHGYFRITERGSDVLKQNRKTIDTKFLEQYPEFMEFKPRQGKDRKKIEPSIRREYSQDEFTPDEILESTYVRMQESLASELLAKVNEYSPAFFEYLVVEVLVKMGYGGSRIEAGKAVGGSGDKGIDGIINQDRLGLDVIYIQAKRWQEPIGSPEIHKFVGALQGQNANRGIFITTSSFTREAENYAAKINPKIVLISGKQLSQLMIEYNVGVKTITVYETKKIDIDYFIES